MFQETDLHRKSRSGELIISSSGGDDPTSLFFEAATQVAAEQSNALFVCFQEICAEAQQISQKAAFASMVHKNPPPRGGSSS